VEQEKVGSLATALAHANRLLATAPAKAEAQAREILKVVPDNTQAIRLLSVSLRLQGRAEAALEALKPALARFPGNALLQFERGLVLAELRATDPAIACLRNAVRLDGKFADAWLALADLLRIAGDRSGADAAYAEHIRASVKDPQLLTAAAALCENRLAVAERLLRAHLKERPTDVAAIRMLAETGSRLSQYADAAVLLERCLELAPGFTAARHNYATILHRQGRFGEALEQTEMLLGIEAENASYRALHAALLGRVGDFAPAIRSYEELLRRHPNQPKIWLSYGHALRAVGRQADSIGAYRRSISLMPSFGEAYWSLANLKTFRFETSELTTMRAQLARSDLALDDRMHLNFALGKALEDEGAFAESFENYDKGNAIRRRHTEYDPAKTSENVARTKALFTAEFLQARAGWGCISPDPIFIVGLPRSGSTLVEQILSSHSSIEGTMELSDIMSLAQRLGGKHKKDERSAYPETLATLARDEMAALGREYLDRTRIQRHLGRPFFIDKMPNNFMHVGFIHLILPNAKIIDARRHPLSCCLSNFKQHFARGQNFTYSLTDIGRYYFDYVELMSHFDSVLAGRIHRIIHERLIENPENEIRRLLAYCGLPFEEECLRFYDTERPVRTASSEQVRQPISTEGLEQWKSFETWLGPLKDALGPVLMAYPDPPRFA
jgi:predicted Zn-dependent protease